jgi:hypothetical protein
MTMSDQLKKDQEPIVTGNLDKLEEAIKKIIVLVEKLPERYREKAFEVLLEAQLVGKSVEQPMAYETPKPSTEAETRTPAKFTMPIDVRAFLQQYNVPEEKLQKLFFMQDNEIRPIYSIHTTKRAKAQIQIALLIALENALKGGRFEFNRESVRVKCKELKCLDTANFQAIFKTNSSLFKSLDDPEHVEISPDGKVELAEAILEIAK